MKKILLIGKFNEITKELGQLLSDAFQVQLCSDSTEIVQGMMKLIAPDLVVISLVGASTAHEEIFHLLIRDQPGLPVVAVGSRTNEQALMDLGVLEHKHIHFICRPVTMSEVVQQIKELPAPSASPSAPSAGPLEPAAPRTKGRPEQKTILVVDDSPAILRAMQSMLASRQYRVTFATSGPQAIATIAKDRPDLILLDYEMPVVNGKTTLEMLRSEDATKDIPVVFLTGMADADHVREVLALKPQGYLLKPPSEERIFSTIEEVLGLI